MGDHYKVTLSVADEAALYGPCDHECGGKCPRCWPPDREPIHVIVNALRAKIEELEKRLAGPAPKLSHKSEWIACAEELPPLRERVEVTGDSGVVSFPYFLAIAYREQYGYANEENPQGLWHWRNVHGNHLSDDGSIPTHWRLCQHIR